MDGANAQPATYFTSLTLENVRCFGGRVTLSLRDREGRPAPWTLILGDNGIGKTTILECLAWMQPDVQSIPQSGNARPLTLDAPAEEEQNSVGQESTQGNKGSLDVDSDQNEGARNILGPILVTGSDEVLESLIR